MGCGWDTIHLREYPYMLHDGLWAQASRGKAGMLCIGCVEGRLGRKLMPDDFESIGADGDPLSFSYRLRMRRGWVE
jgi:hypothetical protein